MIRWASVRLAMALLVAAGCRHSFDRAGDGAAADAPRFDSALDLNSRSDSPARDSVREREARELGAADAPVHDRRSDTLAPDGPKTTACQAGYAELYYDSATEVVVCSKVTGNVMQCDAASACGNGWVACTPSQYRTRYLPKSLTVLPDGRLDQAWVNGCVVKSGVLQSPLFEAGCGDCTGIMGNLTDVLWTCQGGTPISATNSNLGVMSVVEVSVTSSCARLGSNVQSAEGLWTTRDAMMGLSRVLCCK